MKRTTIYLDEEQEIRLKLETQRQGRPMAELIREAISEYLVSGGSGQAKASPGWGQFESGTSDTAEHAEEILAKTGFGQSKARKAALRAAEARSTKRSAAPRAKR